MFGLCPSAPTHVPRTTRSTAPGGRSEERPGETSRAHAAAASAAGRRRRARGAARDAGPLDTRSRPLAERRHCRPGALDGNAPRPSPAAAGDRPGAWSAAWNPGAGAPLAGVARRAVAAGAQGLAGTDPRSVAAYLDEPAIAHFARELDEAAVATAVADQGDGPLDVHVLESAVAGGYGGDAGCGRRRDGVDRRDAPSGESRTPAAARPYPASTWPRHRRGGTTSANSCAGWL